MLNLNRRSFVRGLVLGGAGAVLLKSARAFAQETGAPQYYVHLQLGGGADWLLSLDSRPGDSGSIRPRFDRQAEVRFQTPIDAGIRDAAGEPVYLGPSFAPMMPHLSRSTILRGIQPNTVSHSVGTYYWLTGRFPAGEVARGSSVTALVAAQRGEIDPRGVEKLVPHLSIGAIETFNDGLPSFASALNVQMPSDFGMLLGSGGADRFSDEMHELIGAHVDRANAKSCDRRGLASRYLASFGKARRVLDSELAASLDVLDEEAPPETIAVRERFGASDEDPFSPGAYLATSFLAIKNNLVNAIAVNLAVSDSHDGYSQNYLQAPQQLAIFEAIARFLDLLDETPGPTGAPLSASTTIVLSSEFGRTPELNGVGGRDHWPYNSALIVSPKIRPGVFGATDDNLLPLNVDPADGRTLRGSGVAIEPPNTTASVLTALGLDAQELRAQALPFLQRA